MQISPGLNFIIMVGSLNLVGRKFGYVCQNREQANRPAAWRNIEKAQTLYAQPHLKSICILHSHPGYPIAFLLSMVVRFAHRAVACHLWSAVLGTALRSLNAFFVRDVAASARCYQKEKKHPKD